MMKGNSAMMLMAMWMFIIVIVSALILMPSFGGGSGGSIFKPSYTIVGVAQIHRTYLSGIKIESFNAYKSSSIVPGFIVWPIGGVDYTVTMYVSGPENKVASNSINLRYGEIKTDTLKVVVHTPGTYTAKVVVTDNTGRIVAESNDVNVVIE